ncbi:MAG: hypothetical protein OXC62_00590 [Aestuariivita sp.]|nr:hypothetical protein [Aestuariivita sp.]
MDLFFLMSVLFQVLKRHWFNLSAFLFLMGCSVPDWNDLNPFSDDTGPTITTNIDQISIGVLSGVNDEWPVLIELVRVDQEILIEKLLGINAQQWFDGERNSFRLANPQTILNSWEVVSGTTLEPEILNEPDDYGGVLFCGFIENSPPPQRVVEYGNVHITVEESECIINRI